MWSSIAATLTASRVILGVTGGLFTAIFAGLLLWHWDELEYGHPHVAREHHGHEMLPEVSFEANPDTVSGWNLRIRTTHFRFAAATVGAGFVPNEGHAHVTVDGRAHGRAYGEWYYVGPLSRGLHTIEVRLSANDHSELFHDGRAIAAHQSVEVQ